MYLKSLELQGFKSFPDKTKLTFEAGTTVIVGPNGSGKSNISDAMRWVLGEISSKNIRGNRMEDIIFGGADSRKPMGYAEVSVTFDNRDLENRLDCMYDEVTVTRRYYRSGDSEYYINRQAVRLKDIYELFMNTGVGRDGYSIIGQGKIAEIISRKSDERRSIFEDASGIAKYRHKKTETERKLADTEDNMTRINDVFIEVSAQVGPLEKEAEKASRAIELLETKKRVDVQLWLYDTEKLRAELTDAEENFNRSSFELRTINDTIASYEAQNEKLFDISQNNKYASEQLLSRIGEQTKINHALDSEYQVSKTNIAHAADMMEGSAEVIREYEKAIEDEKSGLAKREERVKELENQLVERQKEHEAAIEEQKRLRAEAEKLEGQIAEALADIRKYEKEETDIKVRLSVIENARADEDGKNSSTLDEIARYEAISKELEGRVKRCEESLAKYDESLAEVTRDINAGHDALQKQYDERMEREDRLAALRLERDSAKQRIDTFRAMEEQFEGYSNSVRFVMKAYAEGKVTDRTGAPCGKIYGPLSKVIRVEDRYVTAIETALAANLQHIVVEDEETAKAAMFALKRAEAGRATFFPITSMRGQEDTHEMRESRKFEGFVSYADELVSCDDKFREIVSSLLGRTVVFDNIDNATKMAKALKYYVKVVTLDGQQIQVGGSFTGGSVRSRGSILGRAGEIRAMEEKLRGIATESDTIARELATLEKAITELEESTSSLEDKRRILDVMRSSENTTLEQHRAKLDANNTLADKLRADYGSVIEQHRRYEEEAVELSARDRELLEGIRAISEFRADKDVERNELLERCDALSNTITELYIKKSETQKDIETERTLSASLDERIASHREGIAAQKRKIEECRNQIAVFENSQKENRARLAEGEKVLADLNSKRALLENDSFEFEKKLSAMTAKIREKRSEQEAIFRENTKNENKLNSLRNEQDKLATKLWDDYELSRAEAVALGYPPITAVTRAATAAKQVDCRNKLRAIGNVDLDAVNKYKEVKERYDYMERQIRDLNDSKQELLKIYRSLAAIADAALSDLEQHLPRNAAYAVYEYFRQNKEGKGSDQCE